MSLSPAYQALCQKLDDLPGIGPDGAARLAEWLVYDNRAADLALALNAVAAGVLCQGCNLVRDSLEHCRVCDSAAGGALVVVETVRDVERLWTAGVRAPIWCLHGLLSPTRGVGPVQLKLAAVIERSECFDRLIVATQGSVEGQVTADYLLKKSPVDGRAVSLPELLSQNREL